MGYMIALYLCVFSLPKYCNVQCNAEIKVVAPFSYLNLSGGKEFYFFPNETNQFELFLCASYHFFVQKLEINFDQ